MPDSKNGKNERLVRLRRAVGAEPAPKPKAGPIGGGSLEAMMERMRIANLREYERLAAGGDNADGLEEWRKLMGRIGRYRR